MLFSILRLAKPVRAAMAQAAGFRCQVSGVRFQVSGFGLPWCTATDNYGTLLVTPTVK
jgi:hypothetical protein